ncbi:MAG: S-adenosylmethionine:tRNA ribosyltransferase-isomerase, partial [Pseudobdellovibrionaceae bacterium]
MSEQNTTPTANFDFQFPESLIATEPSYPPRVLRSLRAADASPAQEISWSQFLNEFQAGDLLIRNSSKVVPRRIFAKGLEILFLRLLNKNQWEVLY